MPRRNRACWRSRTDGDCRPNYEDLRDRAPQDRRRSRVAHRRRRQVHDQQSQRRGLLLAPDRSAGHPPGARRGRAARELRHPRNGRRRRHRLAGGRDPSRHHARPDEARRRASPEAQGGRLRDPRSSQEGAQEVRSEGCARSLPVQQALGLQLARNLHDLRAGVRLTPERMTQLGRYEILQQLATGPVADVLLARAKGLEGFTRHVVVKQIRPELASDERFVHAFLNEARIAASLHHQNIVQVYDIDEDHGRYYFAMEYVHGEDVRKLLLKVRELDTLVPIDQIVAIGAAASAGLHHAHEQVDANRSPLGLVHRDVSPGNILIGYDGSVKLVDFGLAKPALSSAKTRTGSIAGKAPYMSPELCQGKPIDRRSDIFALGIVLCELATAKRLFKGDNDYLTMTAIVNGDVAPPSAHRPDIPRALDEIILRALAKLPAARFQTAMDMRAQLESFALDAELRITGKALADYMNRMFGARAEPWLD